MFSRWTRTAWEGPEYEYMKVQKRVANVFRWTRKAWEATWKSWVESLTLLLAEETSEQNRKQIKVKERKKLGCHPGSWSNGWRRNGNLQALRRSQLQNCHHHRCFRSRHRRYHYGCCCRYHYCCRIQTIIVKHPEKKMLFRFLWTVMISSSPTQTPPSQTRWLCPVRIVNP